jgi:hypothetical protein
VVFSASNSSALLRDRLLVHPKAAQRVLDCCPVDGAHTEAAPRRARSGSAAVLRGELIHLGYSGIAGIRHATVMLGGSLVASLAASRVADLVFDVNQPDYPDWLWQHSVVVASACAVLAPYVGEPVDDAFTTGILHDVGTLMAAANADAPGSTDPVGASGGHDGTDGRMNELVRRGHLLRRWNLPTSGERHPPPPRSTGHSSATSGGSWPQRVRFAAELGAPGQADVLADRGTPARAGEPSARRRDRCDRRRGHGAPPSSGKG